MINLTEGSLDILRELEADARPTQSDLEREGYCLACGGDGRMLVSWNQEDDEPITDACPECGGTGKATPLCPFCGQEAHAKACAELRGLLWREGDVA